MERLKILVVEDEMIIADNICVILEDLGYDVLEPAINYPEAIETIEAENPDLIILDIQLAGKLDGVDLAQTINKDYKIPFIFLTSNSDSQTLERVKKVNPHAFLVKPFKKEDLYTSIELSIYAFQQNLEEPEDQKPNAIIKDAIFVKEKNLFHRVKLSEIHYLKSEHIYVELHTRGESKHLVRANIGDFTERLPDHFFRVHRSYAVNLDHLDTINSSYIIVAGHQIPIGKSYRDALMQMLRLE